MHALFFLSGASALMYEVVWTRRLSLTLGHTVLAISSVVSIYMLGLGIGGFLGGRWSDRRNSTQLLGDYARLEFLIAVWGALSPLLLSLFESSYLRLAGQGEQGLSLYLFGFTGALVVLLLPTMAMGATLPLLSRLVIREHSEFGAELARLYGFNTLGGCLGSLAAGFCLLPWLGLDLTVGVAVLVNVSIAAVAYGMNVSEAFPCSDSRQGRVARGSPGQLLVAFLAAAAAMACQVGWTRGLVLSLGSSTYAFAAILTLFLAGLGLGSLYYPSLIKTATVEKMGWLQFGIGVSVIGSAAFLGKMPSVVLWLSDYLYGSFVVVMLGRLVPVALLLFIPTFLMGMVYPLAAHLYKPNLEGLGRTVGTVYAATTLGSVLGAFGAGFVGIPWFGAQGVIKLAAWASLALALGCFLSERYRFSLVKVALVALAGASCLALPLWNEGVMSSGVGVYSGGEPSGGKLEQIPPTYYRDGLSATVAVHVGPNYQTVRVNGKIDASLQLFDKLTMYLTGYVPGLLLKNAPRDAVVIGFGAGMTVEALSHFSSIERLDCVELEPAMLEAARFWKGYNGDILAHPKVRTWVNDGRTFILSSQRRYDIIASEPSNPWIAGVGTLFTVDFYGYCRQRLKPGGIMCQWFHMYGMSEDSVALVIRTFFHVFPEGAVWRSARGDILLLGSDTPLEVDLAAIEERWNSEPALRRRMLELNLFDPRTLLGHYWLERTDALKFAGEGPLNTDDLPLLEYKAPLTLFEEGTIAVIQSRLDDNRSRLIPVEESPELLSAAAVGWLNVSRDDLVREHLEPESAPLAWAKMLEDSDPEEAQKLYQKVEGPQRWVAEFWRGRLQARGGPSAVALPYFSQALSAVPEPLRLNILLDQAACALDSAKPEVALEASLEALASAGGTDDSRAYLYRGRALYRLGRFEDALREFEVGARLNPAGVGLFLGRAHSLIRLEREADQAFQELFALSPGSLGPYLELSRYQATQGRTEAALETLQKTALSFPEESTISELRARILEGKVSPDEIFE